MDKRMEKLDNLTKRLSEKIGRNLHWYGCNGEFCIMDGFDSYLRGYHSKKELCLYIEGVLSGIDFTTTKH